MAKKRNRTKSRVQVAETILDKPSSQPATSSPSVPQRGSSPENAHILVHAKTLEEGNLIPPFSWVFLRPGRAFVAVMTVIFGFWIGLCLARHSIWDGEVIYWSQELCLVAAFLYAGAFSLILSKNFHRLQRLLLGKNAELDLILSDQNRRFHHAGWLVLMPILLSVLAISLRFLAADYLLPFRYSGFEKLFLIWLFAGFFLLLNAAVLCGRYSEIIRQLGESIIKGHLHRRDLSLISSFYFRIALYSSVFFALSALTVFSLHIIYTYSGNLWPGYAIIRKLPALLWGSSSRELPESLTLIYEAVIIGALYAFASCAALVYFVTPQWSVHNLLVDRKKNLLARIDEDREKAENAMFENPCEKSVEAFCRHSQVSGEIHKLPEWPFAGEGFSGTVLLVLLPGILILLKEIFLEAFVNLLAK